MTAIKPRSEASPGVSPTPEPATPTSAQSRFAETIEVGDQVYFAALPWKMEGPYRVEGFEPRDGYVKCRLKNGAWPNSRLLTKRSPTEMARAIIADPDRLLANSPEREAHLDGCRALVSGDDFTPTPK